MNYNKLISEIEQKFYHDQGDGTVAPCKKFCSICDQTKMIVDFIKSKNVIPVKDKEPKCVCGNKPRAYCGTSSDGSNMYSCSLKCECGFMLKRGKWFDTYKEAKDDACKRWSSIKNWR